MQLGVMLEGQEGLTWDLWRQIMARVEELEDWMKRIEEVLSAPMPGDDVVKMARDHEQAIVERQVDGCRDQHAQGSQQDRWLGTKVGGP